MLCDGNVVIVNNYGVERKGHYNIFNAHTYLYQASHRPLAL